MVKRRILPKTEEEVELMRESALLVSRVLGEVGKRILPGVSTVKLDSIAEEFIRDHGASPAFKDYLPDFGESPFPYTLCISVNEEVVHGMPGEDKFLEEGDIVSVDCGVLLNEYYGDSAYTFAVGEVPEAKKKLLEVTKESLYQGIQKAVAGNRLGQVGNAIQKHAEAGGYSVVRELVGHGLGRHLHEPPEVPNYGKKWNGARLKAGWVIAIEPMINLGKRHVETADDGWTVYAMDLLPSAHFEHTVVIRESEAEVLTTFEYIEN